LGPLLLCSNKWFMLFKRMRFPVLTRILFALGLLTVQTMALVHATGHELRPEHNGTCEVCDLAHMAGGTPAVLDLSKNLVPHGEEPAQPAVAVVVSRSIARPRSRAPPSLLV
jgi:hypothetical protein